MAQKLEGWESKEKQRGLSTESSPCVEDQGNRKEEFVSLEPGSTDQGLLPPQQRGTTFRDSGACPCSQPLTSCHASFLRA